MPSYQSGAPSALNVKNANSSGTQCGAPTGTDCREVPDVSATADPYEGYAVYYDGAWQSIGGTSGATPTWAAFTALTNASTYCHGTAIGFANPVLYAAAADAYSSSFDDITSGTNSISRRHTLYPAGTAYDMASGLGTPTGAPLAATLCNGGTPPAASGIGSVAMPDSSAMPTGVVVDTTDHIAYIAESAANAVAEIAGTNATSILRHGDGFRQPSLVRDELRASGTQFPR